MINLNLSHAAETVFTLLMVCLLNSFAGQEQLRAKLASQSSGARKAARSAKRHGLRGSRGSDGYVVRRLLFDVF